MKKNNAKKGFLTLVGLVILASGVWANGIAKYADPLPNGGGAWMFMYRQGSHGLYGGWAGPPYITLETPLGTFENCTMHAWPMYLYPDGHVAGGNITFYLPNQVQILQIIFTNGFVDYSGLRCGPQTGGSVQFTYSAGGVQLPPGLTEPLHSAWINFEFHNLHQGSMGPEWTASFSCGAVGTKGDLNCDGLVDFADIDPFVQAIADPVGYASATPWCAVENGDVNNDGAVNFNDIDPFVARLSG